MEFLLLGPLEVREGERVIPLGGVKQRALLAALLLHTNEVVSRDRLITSIWAETPPTTAAHVIETYVSRLRRILNDAGRHDPLITRPPGYMLRIDPVELDVSRFENLVRTGHLALRGGNPEAAADIFQSALVLFRGPPLDDVAFFSFTQPSVRRLEEMRLTALEDRIDADLAAGRSGELVGEIEALVNTYPLRERLCGQLMLALYQAGRQADGLEAYRRARQYLAEECGISPSVPLRRLQQAILSQDPSLDAVTPSIRPIRRDAPSGDGATLAIPTRPAAKVPAGHREVGTASLPVQRGRNLVSAPRHSMIALVALLLLATVVAGVRTIVHSAPPVRTIQGNAVGIINPGSGMIVGEISLGASPGRIAAGAGSVWVTDFEGQMVSRLEGGRVRRTVKVDGGPSGIAVGNGAVWVANALDGTVLRINPATNQVVQVIQVGSGPSGVAYGEGIVWVVNRGDDTVVGIDSITGALGRRVRLGVRPTNIAIGAGALWVTSKSAGEVFRIPLSGKDVVGIRVGAGPTGVAVSAGAIWVTNSLDGTVSRIDSSKNVVTATLEAGSDPSDIAVSPDALWVTNELPGTVTRINPHTLMVAGTVRVGSHPHDLAVGGGEVWVAVRASADPGRHSAAAGAL